MNHEQTAAAHDAHVEQVQPYSVLAIQLNARIHDRFKYPSRHPAMDSDAIWRSEHLTATDGSELRLLLAGPIAPEVSIHWDWRLRVRQQRFAVSDAGETDSVITQSYEGRRVGEAVQIYRGNDGTQLADDAELARLVYLVPDVEEK